MLRLDGVGVADAPAPMPAWAGRARPHPLPPGAWLCVRGVPRKYFPEFHQMCYAPANDRKDPAMWSPLILVCAAELCRVISGPQMPTEEDCWLSIQQGAAEIQAQRSDLRLVDAKCIRWDERA